MDHRCDGQLHMVLVEHKPNNFERYGLKSLPENLMSKQASVLTTGPGAPESYFAGTECKFLVIT